VPDLRANGTSVPVDRPAIPENQVASIRFYLHLLAALGSVPVGIFIAEVVAVLCGALVLVCTEAADHVKVLLVLLMGACEDDKPAIIRAVGRHVCDALVELEAVDFAWVLVDVCCEGEY